MLGAILVTIVGGLCFIYITLIYLKKLDKFQEDDGIKLGREKLKWLCNQILKSIKTEVEVIYRDYDSYNSIDRKEGIVFVANHSSNFDIPILVSGIPIDVGFVAKKEMEKWPLYSQWIKKSGSVFLDRKNPREGIKGIKKAVILLQKGHSIVIFPQGRRKIGIEEGDFKKGSFKLAIDSGRTVVPITIIGSDEIQKPFSKLVCLRKKVKIIIGSPIVLSCLTDIELKILHKKVEKQVIENYKVFNVKKM
ncbi:MAG: lysophospholipid acyltransferase family protein [Fusobacteriaceae bacterium]